MMRWIDHLCPNHCQLCGVALPPGLPICPPCHAELPANTCCCAHCALPLEAADLPAPRYCRHCQQQPPPYAVLRAPYRYDYPLPGLITAFKYQHRLALGRLLAGLLAEAVDPAAPPPQLLLPAPLHPRRLRERGFNQAAELTRGLSRVLQIPWQAQRLRRVRHTPPQAHSDREHRLRALRAAYAWSGPMLPAGTRVAIVDDVVTTGATAEAMVAALRQMPGVTVEVWALARTPE